MAACACGKVCQTLNQQTPSKERWAHTPEQNPNPGHAFQLNKKACEASSSFCSAQADKAMLYICGTSHMPAQPLTATIESKFVIQAGCAFSQKQETRRNRRVCQAPLGALRVGEGQVGCGVFMLLFFQDHEPRLKLRPFTDVTRPQKWCQLANVHASGSRDQGFAGGGTPGSLFHNKRTHCNLLQVDADLLDLIKEDARVDITLTKL